VKQEDSDKKKKKKDWETKNLIWIITFAKKETTIFFAW
jgi:hypothetical protein